MAQSPGLPLEQLADASTTRHDITDRPLPPTALPIHKIIRQSSSPRLHSSTHEISAPDRDQATTTQGTPVVKEYNIDVSKNSAMGISAAGSSFVHVGDNIHVVFEHDRASGKMMREAPVVVPFGCSSKDFVGRENILAKLVVMITPPERNEYSQRTAIVGLGGIGKTRIALEAANRVHAKVSDCAIFWVPAMDINSFEDACHSICRKLEVHRLEHDGVDVKELFRAALESRSAGKWLLVVDGADDMDLMFGKQGSSNTNTHLNSYLPSNSGSILFTSRNHGLATRLARKVIQINAMDAHESLELFTQSVNKNLASDRKANELLCLLERLPLAIQQASAYMNEHHITTEKYLNMFKSSDKSRIQLLSSHFEDDTRYAKTKWSANPVATTYGKSFLEIERRDNLAAEYLRFMSFFQQGCPQWLLPCDTEVHMAEAIGILKGYGFITIDEQRGLFNVHSLVRIAVHQWQADQTATKTNWALRAIEQLNKAFQNKAYTSRADRDMYPPHALVILESLPELDDHPAMANLRYNVGKCYFCQGDYKKAELMYRELLVHKRGTNNLDKNNARMGIAHSLSGQGEHAEAEKCYRDILKGIEKELQPDNPKVISLQIKIASELTKRKELDQAEKLYRKIIQATEMCAFDAKDSTKVCLQLCLANLMYSQNRLSEAEEAYDEFCPLFEETAGPEHPHALKFRYNQAKSKQKMGKIDEAERLCKNTLDLQNLIMGPTHPSTIKTRVLHRKIISGGMRRPSKGTV